MAWRQSRWLAEAGPSRFSRIHWLSLCTQLSAWSQTVAPSDLPGGEAQMEKVSLHPHETS